jgi:hypothetical protein
MRHLKTYKTFESVDEVQELVSVLNDMALEINDKDLSCIINQSPMSMSGYSTGFEISILVEKTNDEKFYSGEIEDEIINMASFMKSQNWGVYYAYVAGTPFSDNDVNNTASVDIQDDKILVNRKNFWGKLEKIKLEHQINTLGINFRKIK